MRLLRCLCGAIALLSRSHCLCLRFWSQKTILICVLISLKRSSQLRSIDFSLSFSLSFACKSHSKSITLPMTWLRLSYAFLAASLDYRCQLACLIERAACLIAMTDWALVVFARSHPKRENASARSAHPTRSLCGSHVKRTSGCALFAHAHSDNRSSALICGACNALSSGRSSTRSLMTLITAVW